MKTSAFILIGSLAISSSINAMQNEHQPLVPDSSTLPQRQQLPPEYRVTDEIKVDQEQSMNEHTAKFREQAANLKAAKESRDRKFTLLTICYCPCLTVEAILKCICSPFSHQAPASNNR